MKKPMTTGNWGLRRIAENVEDPTQLVLSRCRETDATVDFVHAKKLIAVTRFVRTKRRQTWLERLIFETRRRTLSINCYKRAEGWKHYGFGR